MVARGWICIQLPSLVPIKHRIPPPSSRQSSWCQGRKKGGGEVKGGGRRRGGSVEVEGRMGSRGDGEEGGVGEEVEE